MKTIIIMLSFLFSTLELGAQVVLAPLTLLTVIGLAIFTALMGRQLRKGSWLTQANWQHT